MHDESKSIRALALRIAKAFNETMDNLIALHAVNKELADGENPHHRAAAAYPSPISPSSSPAKPKSQSHSATELRRLRAILQRNAQLGRAGLQRSLKYIESVYATLIDRREDYIGELTTLRTFLASHISKSLDRRRTDPAHQHDRTQLHRPIASKERPAAQHSSPQTPNPAQAHIPPRDQHSSLQTPNPAQAHIPPRARRNTLRVQQQSSPPQQFQRLETATPPPLLFSDSDSDGAAGERRVSFAKNTAWNHTPASVWRRELVFPTDHDVWGSLSPSPERELQLPMQGPIVKVEEEEEEECMRTHPPAMRRRRAAGVDGMVKRRRVRVRMEKKKGVAGL
jgi:hypothetical protein